MDSMSRTSKVLSREANEGFIKAKSHEEEDRAPPAK